MEKQNFWRGIVSCVCLIILAILILAARFTVPRLNSSTHDIPETVTSVSDELTESKNEIKTIKPE